MKPRSSTLAVFSVLCLVAMCCVSVRAADAPQAESLSDTLSDRIVSATQGWGELGINVSAAQEGQQPLKLRIKDKEYKSGLGHHANGEIVVNLGRQFRNFETEVGVQWQGGSAPASVVFQIHVDGKKVFDSGVMHESDAPRPVSISVDGAKELRLSVSDAGDGISFDCVVWANARLTRDPAAPKETPDESIDVAPFAVVASWDPKVMTGTKANRVQEMPAEDVAPYKELLPSADGTYSVPDVNGQGCIGLQWLENRMLRRVALQFADGASVPSPDSVQLQYWNGASAWQGGWQPVAAVAKKVDNSLVWHFGFKQVAKGTPKVRWIFTANQPVVVKGMSAYTMSQPETIDIQIEATHYVSPDAVKDLDVPVTQLSWAPKAEIGVYNGSLLDAANGPSHHVTWTKSKPLVLKVRYTKPQRYKADRTVLRFELGGVAPNVPGAAFGVAIEDLLTNDCVYVPHADVFVTRLPAPVTLDEYVKKIAGRKTVLEQVREKPDQDFPHAWSVVHNPIQDLGPTMLSLANDNRKFIVLREGGVLFDQYDRPDDPRAAFPGTIYQIAFHLPWQCMPTFGSGKDLKITRNLLSDWLPIPVTKATDGGMVYHETSLVAPMSDTKPGLPLWLRDRAMCVADYHIRNGGNEAAPAKLALRIANDKQKPFTLQDVKEGVLVVAEDRVVALVVTDDAAPLTVKREADGVVLSGSLAAEGVAHCDVYFPGWKVAPRDYASLLKVDGRGSLLSRVESYWRALFEPAMQIEIPDEFLSNIIRASQVHCMMAARCEERGSRIAAWTAATVYGPLESESNSIIRGMDLNGQSDFARRSLDFFLALGSKEGFITTGYTLVGTGEVLWTLGEHYARTRDREWMKNVAPEVVRVCQWVMRQRAKTKRLDARGQKAPEYGLMTPGVSADWDRFAYRFFNDAQFCAGLELAGRALADVGDPAAPAILADAKQYREDIVRAYRRAQACTPVVRLENGTWAPGDVALMNCLGRVEDFLPAEDVDRTWGYSIELGSHHLATNGVLDVRSPETNWIIDYLEDVQFLRNGWGDYPEARNRQDVFCFGGSAKLQPYYCRIAELHAMRDDVKAFIRSYFNTIPIHVGRENLALWEHLANRGAWNKTHETGWLLCQSRIMFVDERGDELWLAPFVTNHWMKDGMKVSIGNAPTRFGSVGYTITSKVASGQIEAVVQLPKDCTAKKVVLRLRHPDGKPMQSVTVNGQPHKEFDPQKETVTFAPSGESVTVRAEY
jgi:hypothetical protein